MHVISASSALASDVLLRAAMTRHYRNQRRSAPPLLRQVLGCERHPSNSTVRMLEELAFEPFITQRLNVFSIELAGGACAVRELT